MNRRSFLGALAALVAAPRLLAKLAPTPLRWPLPWEDMPIGVGEIAVGERLSFIRSRKLPPSMRIYGDPALLRRFHLRAPTGFAAWERRVLG